MCVRDSGSKALWGLQGFGLRLKGRYNPRKSALPPFTRCTRCTPDPGEHGCDRFELTVLGLLEMGSSSSKEVRQICLLPAPATRSWDDTHGGRTQRSIARSDDADHRLSVVLHSIRRTQVPHN